MLHLAEAAELGSTHNQTTLIWNQLAVNPCRDIPEPRAITTLSRFIDQVDSKTATWTELAMHHFPSSTPERHTLSKRKAPQQYQR